MKTTDHLALGHFLLDSVGSSELLKHRRAFLLGCVEPDYNKATYLRGMKACQKFRGHNAENSFAHVSKCAAELQTDGLRTPWDYFTLGTMLHYVADAFTWPHNAFWKNGLVQHAAYEMRLHSIFSEELLRRSAGTVSAEPRSLIAFFAGSHQAYSAAPHRMETDCRYIIDVCERLLRGSLCCAVPRQENEPRWREAVSYAGSYSHGLV